MDVVIRTMTSEEIPQAIDLINTTVTDEPQYISHGEIQMCIADGPRKPSASRRDVWRRNYTRLLAEYPRGMLVAEHAGQIIGFVCAQIECGEDSAEDPADANRFGVVGDVCVISEWRNHGIGTRLVRAAIDAFAQDNVRRVFLESGLDNSRAHSLFERLGFQRVSFVFMGDF